MRILLLERTDRFGHEDRSGRRGGKALIKKNKNKGEKNNFEL